MRSANSAFKPFQKRPLAPDNHPASDAIEPPAKRRRITLSLQASGTKTTNPFEQITRDKILQQVAHSSSYLDLSALCARELIMLPADALGSACANVCRLRLPCGLWRLPAFCQQMPALRELHLPDFYGDTLDLTDLPQLQRVEGSAGVRLDSVHADARTELAIDIPLRLRKVRVQRYVDGQPGRTHALPGHAYTHIAPGADAPDYTQFNGIACFPDNGQPIFCRHIARHVEETWRTDKQAGKTSAPGFAGLATPADVATKIDSGTEARFTSDFNFSKAYEFVDDTNFGAFTSKQLDMLMQWAELHSLPKAQASYYLVSTNHVMNMILGAKATNPPVYSATVIDPNALLARRRIESNSLAAIQHVARGWTLSALVEPSLLRTYADPTRLPLMYIFNSQHRANHERPSVLARVSDTQLLNGELYYALMALGLHESLSVVLGKLLDAYQQGTINGAQVFHALAARHVNEGNGLSAALTDGDSACVRLFIAAVERLAATRTAAHLLNAGPDKLPDQWCESLLTTTQSWAGIVLEQAAESSADLAHLVAACERLLRSGDLSAQACLRFLNRGGDRNQPTWNAIDAAVATKNDALLSAFGSLVVALHTSGSVSPEQLETVVNDRGMLWTWIPSLPLSGSDELVNDDPMSLADLLFGPDEQ